MATSSQTYVAQVTRELAKALCIQSYPSPKAERYNAPFIETQNCPELLGAQVTIQRSDKECCFIEPSMNSVRVSLRFNTSDALEVELLAMTMKFLMQRAESLQCLRKVPIKGYHVTFLITDENLVTMGKATIIKLITDLIQQCESQLTSLKLAVNARGRAVAQQLLKSLAF